MGCFLGAVGISSPLVGAGGCIDPQRLQRPADAVLLGPTKMAELSNRDLAQDEPAQSLDGKVEPAKTTRHGYAPKERAATSEGIGGGIVGRENASVCSILKTWPDRYQEDRARLSDAESTGCFPSAFVLKIDGRAAGKFEGRWMSEGIHLALVESRRLWYER